MDIFIAGTALIAFLLAPAAGIAMANFWIDRFHLRRIRMMIYIILSLFVALCLEMLVELEIDRRGCSLCAL